MTLADDARERVAAELARLRDEHGDYRLVEHEWDVHADRYATIRERLERGTLGGAGAWVRNGAGEVLLVRELDEHGWSEPSGKQEPGETFEATARREVREETGVEARLTGVELAQRIRYRHGDDPPLSRLVAVFAARGEGDPTPREGEIAAARWFDAAPDEWRYPELDALPIPAGE